MYPSASIDITLSISYTPILPTFSITVFKVIGAITNNTADNKQSASSCLLYTSDAADEQRGGDFDGRRNIQKKKK